MQICDIYILAEQQLRQFIGTLLHRNGTILPDSILQDISRKLQGFYHTLHLSFYLSVPLFVGIVFSLSGGRFGDQTLIVVGLDVVLVVEKVFWMEF